MWILSDRSALGAPHLCVLRPARHHAHGACVRSLVRIRTMAQPVQAQVVQARPHLWLVSGVDRPLWWDNRWPLGRIAWRSAVAEGQYNPQQPYQVQGQVIGGQPMTPMYGAYPPQGPDQQGRLRSLKALLPEAPIWDGCSMVLVSWRPFWGQ